MRRQNIVTLFLWVIGAITILFIPMIVETLIEDYPEGDIKWKSTKEVSHKAIDI